MFTSRTGASFRWPFLIAMIFLNCFSIASAKDISTSAKWKKLNYYHNEFMLRTNSFLVSNDIEETSLKSELVAFLTLVESTPSIKCKFPARYSFLVSNGLIPSPLDYNSCPDLTEYLSKVPVHSFYYVYAAENINSVTSMMGHGFLMSEGLDERGEIRQYSYSYFAELNSNNPINLLYRAMISGLDGKFALHPYQKDVKKYSEREQRELWSYRLRLTDSEVRDLQLLLWELKDVDLTYHFHSFNCATLILHALSIIKPQLADYDVLFVSPLDIAKALEKEGYVNNVAVRIPNSLHKTANELDAYQITKKPTLSPQDSAISTYLSDKGLNIALLPTSHFLRTPSSYRSSRNELHMGYIDFNLRTQSINEIALYSFKDYHAGANNKPSSELYIGYRPSWLNGGIKTTSLEYLLGSTYKAKGLQISGLVGFSYDKTAALDAKINTSLGHLGDLAFSAFAHTKKDREKQRTLFGSELSAMLSLKYNLFLRQYTTNAENHTISIGIDYHF